VKKLLLGIIIGLCVSAIAIRAQSNAPYSFSVIGVAGNCPPVAVSVTQFCFTADKGLLQSIAGAAWATAGSTGGVTSIIINGGPAQAGIVPITIPTKAMIQSSSAPLQ
jgi:hypothetical protein